jgi:hypothetical protein
VSTAIAMFAGLALFTLGFLTGRNAERRALHEQSVKAQELIERLQTEIARTQASGRAN